MKLKSDLYNAPVIYSLQEMILRSAELYSNKLALEDLTDTPLNALTYSELLRTILRFGKALKDLGLAERSHIAVIGENRVQWAVSYLTCMCFNYVIVPIDKNLTSNEILNILHESDSQAVIFSGSFTSLMDEKRSVLKRVSHYICMDDCAADRNFISMKKMIDHTQPIPITELPVINPSDLAEIIFTSGSLGRAKGVMLTQKNLSANLVDMISMMFIYPEDKFLSVLPMHHTYECTCGLLCPLYSGASIHYARSLKTVVDDIQKVKATILLGVPLLYEKMYKRIIKTIEDDVLKSKIVPVLRKLTNLIALIGFPDLRKIIFKELHHKFGGNIRIFIAGGAAPDPLVAKGLREFGFTFLQGYGLTETSPILTLNRIDQFKDDAAGLPLPNISIKIVNPDEDGVGEIFVKGPSVMPGYYNNENATKDAFEDGWFRTGDLGKIDEEGFLYIRGRKKNVIISNSGKNVFPEEIEDILNRSPFILESLVFGQQDEKHDEIITAQIVVDADSIIAMSENENIKITSELVNKIISDEIKKVNDQLASYKQIRKFIIRENEFEKTTTQKIKRYLVNKE